MKKPYFSILIPTKNEEKNLSVCLAALIHQSTSLPYEIIILDNNSSDRTLKIATQHHARIIKEPRSGKSAAYQQLMTIPTGDILCFTEADCIVPNTWLERIHQNLTKHPKAVAVTGVYTFYESTWLLNFLVKIVHPLGARISQLFFHFYAFRNTNFAIRKNIYIEVGGFDPRYEELFDFELSRRIGKKYQILFDPHLTVTTSDRRFRGRIIQYIWEFTKTCIVVVFLGKPTKRIYADIR